MVSTFHGIETAKRSLTTQQTALNTLGHNIANANTEGYTRQRVTIKSTSSMEAYGMSKSTAAGQLGTGVEATAITRVRTAFLDEQFRNESKYLGSWEVQSDTMNKLESVMNEPSDTGLRTVIEGFWSSWSDLSTDPENTSNRQLVIQNAVALTDSLNQMSSQLQDLSDDLTGSITTKAADANSLLESIAQLNGQIKKIEATGDDANDLRDKRDLYTDQLSKLVNVSVQDTSDGYTITMGNITLVEGTDPNELTADTLTAAYASGDLSNGEIFGTFVSRDVYVKDYQSQLDLIAKTMAEGEIQVTIPSGSYYNGATTTADQVVTVKGINGLHKLGYTLESPLTSGQDFFTYDTTSGATEITAASIRVNPNIEADSNKIAASMRSSTTTTGLAVVAGNNTLALLMSELQNTNFSFDDSANGGSITDTTIGSFYTTMVGAVGIQSQEATRQYENSTSLVDQVDSSRQSESGVSLDEEMSDMVKFQNAYNAAARFMTTYDETLEKLINGTGRVGL